MRQITMNTRFNLIFLFILLAGCNPVSSEESADPTAPEFVKVGELEAKKLDEASGIQAGNNGGVFPAQ